jgi:2-polyprenyl-3-methyl-5-hydroxy-6-metoxy-1,4-benzoquinol methylase
MIIKTTQDEMRKIACEWINPNEKMIVEVGCSSGNFAKLLNDKKIYGYIGIDILSEKIKEAKNKYPNMIFMVCDITTNLYMLKSATTFVSFQCLEHIENDLDIIKEIPSNSKTIISVPNSPYGKEHKRWFELDGWLNRYSQYINIKESITIQNPVKAKKRCFLFRGVKI